ncbi:MAG: sugar phosphate isomerase/epimerase [Anaerolineae bacterium]
MKLGMLTGELRRSTPEELFRTISALGFADVQLELGSVLPGPLPEKVEDSALEEIYAQASGFGVEIAAVGGTYNMIHPDLGARALGLKRFESIAATCAPLHCRFVTLCTGTRHPENMWRWHDDNLKPDAWDDLLVSMEQVLVVAERYDLLLGIETEASNVINSAEKARKLLDTFDSPRLKIIMDVANLFQRGDARPENVRPIMDKAFALLGPYIQMAHGKDIQAGEGLACTHAGHGIIDFGYFVDKLQERGYTGGMLVHGIKDERYFPEVVAFMRGVLESHAS